MLSTDETIPESTDYYGQAREVALAYGWVTVSLIQRKLRLSYGFTLSLVEGLEHRGVVGPIDATGRRLLLLHTGNDMVCAEEASESTVALAPEVKLRLAIVPESPLRYSLNRDKATYAIDLTPSLRRFDDFYNERSAEPQATEKTVFTRYFSADSQHGTFEALVQCLRPCPNASFEVETVTVVVQPENLKITQLPTFTIMEDGTEDFNKGV